MNPHLRFLKSCNSVMRGNIKIKAVCVKRKTFFHEAFLMTGICKAAYFTFSKEVEFVGKWRHSSFS